ncbi:MAG: DUF1003 domain-containing protein [Chitinophagaceae bacterium]|nr:DUF1003 domain-containing protein [Chitinophagaceae bacterium]MCB9045177.1 DUF1003 domain-containing protein [Chitinophagales bacterium]
MEQALPQDEKLSALLNTQNEHLKKLNEIVAKSIQEEQLLTTNLLNPPTETITRGQKLSDKIAQFGGSWMFIISFLTILMVWIVYNVTASPKDIFDPYPFILMNLLLSCIAAIQAPIIMMSQNRKEEKDRKRAENDYMVNLKAELEIRSLHAKIDLLIQEQIKTLYDFQVTQMEQLQKLTADIDKNNIK